MAKNTLSLPICLPACFKKYTCLPWYLLKFLNVTNSLRVTIWFSSATVMNKYFNVYIPLPLRSIQIVGGKPFLYQIYQLLFQWAYWLFFKNNGNSYAVLQVSWIWQYGKEMLYFLQASFQWMLANESDKVLLHLPQSDTIRVFFQKGT